MPSSWERSIQEKMPSLAATQLEKNHFSKDQMNKLGIPNYLLPGVLVRSNVDTIKYLEVSK
jgi:hypothetical protein